MERFPEKELDSSIRNGIPIATGTLRSSLFEIDVFLLRRRFIAKEAVH